MCISYFGEIYIKIEIIVYGHKKYKDDFQYSNRKYIRIA